VKSKIWDTFLPIANPATSDKPPLDSDWLLAHGISDGAPLVLAHVRDDVLPLIRTLERANKLAWYMFLVHDLKSGVPTTPDDKSAYVHLRLVFKRTERADVLPEAWLMSKPMKPGYDVDGELPRLIGYQSECVLRMVETLKGDGSEMSALKQMRQFLHYFANMTQMKVA
jgi:hypothetical protein